MFQCPGYLIPVCWSLSRWELGHTAWLGMCVCFGGHGALTLLCPQGVPGPSGLKGDKVDGTMLLALLYPSLPLTSTDPRCHLQPPLTSRDPLPPTDSPRISLMSCRSPGRPWRRAARGPRRAWGTWCPGMYVLLCIHGSLYHSSHLSFPASNSVNSMSPSRVKMGILARRDPEDSRWVPLGKAPVM